MDSLTNSFADEPKTKLSFILLSAIGAHVASVCCGMGRPGKKESAVIIIPKLWLRWRISGA